MKLSLTVSEYCEYLSAQLNHFFPDRRTVQLNDYRDAIDSALQRVEFCFKHIALKHYYQDGEANFNHLYSDQYAMFLWFVANTIWDKYGYSPLLDKFFGLNKALHSFECMYNTALPNIFFLGHTVGTVLGKATYNDFLVVSQGCTIGSHKGKYPILGKGIGLAVNASILGECMIGDNVSVGSNTTVFKKDIARNTTVYTNETGVITFRSAEQPYAQNFFNVNLNP